MNSQTDNKTRLNVRFSDDVWLLMDAARGKRAGYVSRNSWILEAVLEKLAKEQEDKPFQVVSRDA